MTTGLLSTTANASFAGTGWNNSPPGAGGYVSAIDASSDWQTVVCRSDTGGAYLWSPGLQQWLQLITQNRFPVNTAIQQAPCYECRVAPSNNQVIYVAVYNELFYSTNRGLTFTQSTSFGTHSMSVGGNERLAGYHGAVDPQNPNIFVICTDVGIFYTTNGGTTFTAIATGTIPAPSGSNNWGIVAFDPSSAVSGGATQGIYIAIGGSGVWHTTGGLGGSWTNIASSSGPTDGLYHMCVDASGNLYGCPASANHIWKWNGSSWSDLYPNDGNDYVDVILDTANAGHFWALENISGMYNYYNGSAFTGYTGFASALNGSPNDVQWFAGSNDFHMSYGKDLLASDGTVWRAWGFGVHVGTKYLTNGADNSRVWNSRSLGISNVDAKQIIHPPSGGNYPVSLSIPLLLSQDLAIFTLDNLEIGRATNQRLNNTTGLSYGSCADWATSDPNFICTICNAEGSGGDVSGYSNDGGHTWSNFGSVAPTASGTKLGGCIAAASPDYMIWSPADSGNPYYTLDGGNTWTELNFSSWNVPTTGTNGWPAAYYLGNFTCCADRVTPNTFYLYNYGSPATSATGSQTNGQGVYKVVLSSGGATITQQSAEYLYNPDAYNNSNFNAQLAAAPMMGTTNTAGHLFFTVGGANFVTGGTVNLGTVPKTYSFCRSTDGGVTWSAVQANGQNIYEVNCFGFGACGPGEQYPSVWIAGWVYNGSTYVYGIYVSYDDCSTWTQVGPTPLGVPDPVIAIDGDKSNYKRCYVGTAGTGFYFYNG